MTVDAALNNKLLPHSKIILFRLVLSLLLVSIWPVVLFRQVRQNKQTARKQESYVTCYNFSDLRNKTIVKDIGNRHLSYVKGIGSEKVPFGTENARWHRLLGKMLDGDELHDHKHRDVVTLVRNGEVIDGVRAILVDRARRSPEEIAKRREVRIKRINQAKEN